MLDELTGALSAALNLDAASLEGIGLFGAIDVAILASVSTMLGHSTVLLLNRIRGLRLLSTLVLNGLILVSLRILQVALTWLVAGLVLPGPVGLESVLVIALVSLAPQVFGVLTAAPHVGLFIGRVLEAWSFLILAAGVSAVFALAAPSAIAVALAGWAAMQLVSRLLRVPATRVVSKLWTLATGREQLVTARDILAGTPVMPLERGRSAA